MEYTSTALLLLEWDNGVCRICGGNRPNHDDGCVVDHALEERGLTTQTNRDAARKLIELTPPTAPVIRC